METVTGPRNNSTVTVLSVLLSTRYGPVYGGSSDARSASFLRKTWVHELRSLWTKIDLFPCLEAGTGLRYDIWYLGCVTKSSGCSVCELREWRNLPEMRKGSPYTISTAAHCKSSFHALLMPRRTIGSTSVHLVLMWAMMVAFRVRWSRSTMELACGW